MLARYISIASIAAVMVALSGCGPAKLDASKTLSIDPADAKAIDLDPQPKPQTLTVEFDAGSEVSVYAFKASDVPKDDDLLTVPASKALASQTGTKVGSFAVEVPEKTAVRIVVREPKGKTEVNLHITNR